MTAENRVADARGIWLATTLALVGLLIGALWIGMGAPSWADDGLPTQVGIVPRQSVAAPGQTFNVTVWVTDAVKLRDYQFRMGFDPEMVTVTQVIPGGFVSGLSTPVGARIFSDYVEFGQVAFGGSGEDGDGALAVITLEALELGSTTLEMQEVYVKWVENGDFPVAYLDDASMHDGHVRVVEPGTVYQVTLAAAPANLTVGETSHLTATVKDGQMDPLAGRSVVFTTDLGELGSQTVTRSTNAQGEAYASLSSITPGIATVNAVAEGVAADPAQVVFAPAEVASVDLNAHPARLTVGGSSHLTATVTDDYGNPIVTQQVVFSADLGNLADSPVTRTTDGQGRAFAALTSTTAGTATVVAAAGAREGGAQVVFEPGAPDRLAVSPDPATVAVSRTRQFQALGYDVFDNAFEVDAVWSVTDARAGTIDSATGIFTAGVEPGFYPAAVVAAAQGLTATADVTVTETCDDVAISALESNSPVHIGELMRFTATVTGTLPYTFHWDFGGAGTAAGAHTATPTYRYDATGAYTVTLIVDNPCSTAHATLPSVRVELYRLYLPVVLRDYSP